MAKNKKNVPKLSNKKTKVPQEGLEVKDNIDHFKLSPVFKFYNADSNNWTLNEWSSTEIKDLVKTFKLMEQISWYDIQKHGGLRLKSIKNIEYPDYISPDETIYEIRVCDEKRLFGFINKNIFNLIWFDRDHSVCPEGKNRKHG